MRSQCPIAHDKIFQSWPPTPEILNKPFNYFDKIRHENPVYLYPEKDPSGTPFYIVTGYKEACTVLSKSKIFLNSFRIESSEKDNDIDLEPLPLPEAPVLYETPNIFFTDGEDHKVKRSWAMKFVERDKLPTYRPVIKEAAETLIDGFKHDGKCDFRDQFTEKMSMTVIRKLMGLPEITDAKVKRMSIAIGEIDNNPEATKEQLNEVTHSSAEVLTLCAEHVLSRFNNPTGDFVSEIVQTQVDMDGVLDPNTLAKQVMVTLFGADHAMGGHIADVVSRLSSDQALQQRIRDDRSFVMPLIYETLRSNNPVPWLFRRCGEETTIGVVTIPEGATILVSTIAANFDGDEFENPYEFNIDRAKVGLKHLALGRGNHRCLGAPLAEIQAEITVNTLLDKLNNIQLNNALSDLTPIAESALGFRIPKAVHITFNAK